MTHCHTVIFNIWRSISPRTQKRWTQYLKANSHQHLTMTAVPIVFSPCIVKYIYSVSKLCTFGRPNIKITTFSTPNLLNAKSTCVKRQAGWRTKILCGFIIRSDYFTGYRFHRKQNGLRYTVATCPCYCFIGPVLTPGKQDFILRMAWKCFKWSIKIKNSFFLPGKSMGGQDG